MDVAKHIQPSPRGELEITTVNQEFLNDHQLKVQLLGRGFAGLTPARTILFPKPVLLLK